MRLRTMTGWAAITAVTIVAVAIVLHAKARDEATSGSGNCEPVGEMRFICGLTNPEDLVQIPGSDWVIVSSMPGATTPGKLYGVNLRTHALHELYPGTGPRTQLDSSTYERCPGPPPASDFSPHGVALGGGANGKHRLFITAHGSRESVEVFDIKTADRTQQPELTWVGCVEMPAIGINSVAVAPVGDLLVTKMFDGELEPEEFDALKSGADTGFVYRWQRGDTPQPLKGTELSGPNGIVVSRDGEHMYVAEWGKSQLVRFKLRNGSATMDGAAELPVRPDNLRWSPDGQILATGQVLASPDVDCGAPACFAGWAVVQIDPQTLATRPLVTRGEDAPLQGATAAIEVGGEYWVGAFTGDRIAVVAEDNSRR